MIHMINYFYSSICTFFLMQHDDTVVALLSALKYYRYPEFPGVQPQYSTSVVLELHEQTPENFVVKIFLRNVTNSTDLRLYPIPIQGKAFDNWLKRCRVWLENDSSILNKLSHCM